MNNYFKKTIIRMAFDAVFDELKNELFKEGFEIAGEADYQNKPSFQASVTRAKYKVLAAFNPDLYKEMMMISPVEGIVLPCSVSVIELYPGETAIVPYNATEEIVRGIQNPSLLNLAAEVSRRLDLAIDGLRKEQAWTPDLVTSWS